MGGGGGGGGAGMGDSRLYSLLDRLVQLVENVSQETGGVDTSTAHSQGPGQAGGSEARQARHQQQAEYHLQLV